jgi:hypothetical protein
MIFTQEIDEEAIKYIIEVKRLGGKLHSGNKDHNELIHTSQTLVNNRYNNEPNQWNEGKLLSWKLDLMENIHVPEGCFFQVKISEKGNNVSDQLKR